MISCDGLIIRALEKEDITLVKLWNSREVRGRYQEFTFSSSRELEHRFQEDGCNGEDYKALMLETEHGEGIGLIHITFVRLGVVRVTLDISNVSFRGSGVGTLATQIITAHLFENYPVERIEAETDASNLSACRVLEKANFLREGVMRKYRFHHGKWHDFVLFSLIREDLLAPSCACENAEEQKQEDSGIVVTKVWLEE